jgi:CubicO group peptidase (beta-lactamase class C family)
MTQTPSRHVDPVAAGMDPARLARLPQALQQRIDAGRLPGAVVQVERHGALACFEALGRLDPARDTPMPPDAIFRIYSMTKPIVSLAAMMLVEEGRLLLGDPVSRHLPEFGRVRVAVTEGGGAPRLTVPRRVMTVHDLLRHTAGLTYEFHTPSAVRARYAEVDIASRQRSNAEFCRALAALPLMHEPGTVWDYSRATDVLSGVIEAVTGRTLGEHLRRAVFDPLGMVDTGFHVPPAQHHRIAEPYAADPVSGAPATLNDVRQPVAFEGGGGALVSTASDYARFLRLMLDEGTLDGVRLLSRQTLRWMVSDHVGDLPRVEDILVPGYGFGLGVAVRTHAGLAGVAGSVGDYGWSGAAGTCFFVDPAERMVGLALVQAPGMLDEMVQLLRNCTHGAIAG